MEPETETGELNLIKKPILLETVTIMMASLTEGGSGFCSVITIPRVPERLSLFSWDAPIRLGLVEKNIMNYDFDLVASDPSDANTTSTALFSDDTDDKSKRSTNPEAGISIQQVQEASVAIAAEEIPDAHVSEYHQPGLPGISDYRTGAQEQHPSCNRITDGHFSSGPKKSELRIGESPAFFTYVKEKMLRSNFEEIVHVDNNATKQVEMEDMNQTCAQQEWRWKT